MTSLQQRMELMDLYGLRMPIKELFGHERGHEVSFAKDKVNRRRVHLRRLKMTVTPSGCWKHPKELRDKVVQEAIEATKGLGAYKRGRNKLIEDIGKKYGVPAQTVRRWLKTGYHR